MADTLPDIIARYLNGESLLTLADEYHITRRTLYNWMYRLGDEQYAALKEQAYFNRIADADEELQRATDPLQLARARESAKFARWDAERRLPHLFGPKQEISTRKQVVIVVDRSVQPPVPDLCISAQVDTQSQKVVEPTETVVESELLT